MKPFQASVPSTIALEHTKTPRYLGRIFLLAQFFDRVIQDGDFCLNSQQLLLKYPFPILVSDAGDGAPFPVNDFLPTL